MNEKLEQVVNMINNLIELFKSKSIDYTILQNTIKILEDHKNNPEVLDMLLKETYATIIQVTKKLNESNSKLKRKKINLSENIDIYEEKKESEQLINNLYL